MNAIVYLNTGVPVSTSRHIFSSQKHMLSLLLRLLMPIKNTTLHHRWRDAVCHYRQRIRVAGSKQMLVFNGFMRDIQ